MPAKLRPPNVGEASPAAELGQMQSSDAVPPSVVNGARGPSSDRSSVTGLRAVRRITAFFAVAALAMWGLHLLINAGFRRIETSAYGVTNQIVSGRINADVVISGSSRALVHYDPRIVQHTTGHHAYNIGRNGAQTDTQLMMLKAYLRHNAKPKLVVHNLDLFSFVTSREIYDPAQYMPYLGEEIIYSGVARIHPHAWKWKYIPLYGYAVEDMRFTWLTGLKGFVGINPPEDHFQGFVPRYQKWTGDFERFRETNAGGVTFEIEERGVQDVTEIAELCRQHGIPLIFVYSPEYAEMQALERNRAEVFAKFREICARFNVQLWDFSDSPICRRQEWFYNSQHLNAEGAAAFSRDFAGRLAQSGLLSRPENAAGSPNAERGANSTSSSGRKTP